MNHRRTRNRQQWEAIAADPVAWQLAARDRVCAGNVLRDRFLAEFSTIETQGAERYHLFSLAASMYLQFGLAIENLLKGLLIARGYPATVNGKLNPALRPNGGHDLVALAGLASLSVDERDRHLLRTLSGNVRFSAKYYVDLKPAQEGTVPPHVYDVESDIARIHLLLARLEDDLRAAFPQARHQIDLTRLCFVPPDTTRRGNS